VMFFFTIPCNPSDKDFCPEETLCPDSVESEADVAAQDDLDDGVHLTTNVVNCGTVHVEKFDTPGDVDSWENGVYTTIEGVGSFLGRLGHENPMVQKTFIIPESATKVVLSFIFIDIMNVVKNGDSVEIGIQNSWMEVKLTTKQTQYHSDIEITKEDVAEFRLQLDVSADANSNAYTISVDIDSRWWNNFGDNLDGYNLPIGFRVTTENPIEEESYGIEQISLTADCGRRLDNQLPPKPEMEPSDDGEDGSFYCKAADYPCGEGTDTVHVCHFSTNLGYQTFCIPDSDSEVLRFYGKDYCGPCVGGFGGINMQ
jgi:hypothetical protein